MKIGITGSSGYFGTLLARLCLDDQRIDSVVGVDIREPSLQDARLVFIRCDVRDRALARALAGCDTVVHLAFIVEEIRDKKLAYDININGTRNLLDACSSAGPRKLVAASSIAAYGSIPGRAAITEDSPLEGNKGSYYAETKRLVEKMLDEFEARTPGMIVTRLRPSICCGRHVTNFLRDVVSAPVIAYVRGNPEGLPLVHEDDLARAFFTAVVEDHPGAFNIDAGLLPAGDIARILRKKAVPVPWRLARPLADLGYRLGLLKFSSHWVELARYPMYVSTRKAAEQLGWRPTRSPEQAFRELVEFAGPARPPGPTSRL
jgi:UDP-glucose 4-epimerase